MPLVSPTRADIEAILATIPVARTKPARTVEKKAARNVKRRDAVLKLLQQKFDDPRVIDMVMTDLDSYIGYEEEVDDA